MASSPLTLPWSFSTVEVAIIDTTSWIGNIPAEIAMSPIYPGCKRFEGPSYSFLIAHKSTKTHLLFDLGTRKNWETKMSPEYLELLKPYGMTCAVAADVADILTADGVGVEAINAIIWSHHHWDHTGDVTKFPSSTDIIVGPGFKETYLPGWPVGSAMTGVTADNLEGRKVREITFSSGYPGVSQIGQFRAYDYFGDGSFYILDTPGHTVGHLSALARTTASTDESDSTFIFMGGDVVHHNAVFRPSESLPLPPEIHPNPYLPPFQTTQAPCPGNLVASIHYLATHTSKGHQELCHTQPFGRVAGPEHDLAESQRSADKLMTFDALDNVLTVFAHDKSLMSVIDFFPKPANDWKAKGWGREGHWRFLTELLPHDKYEQLIKATVDQ